MAALTKSVTKKELLSAMLRWMFFQTSCWNWERMQNMGWCWHLVPLLKRFYPNPEDLREALKRHLVFYNTEPTLSQAVSGVVISLEEQRAAGADIPDETINAVKTGLMGPLAAIGDSILASAANAVLLSIGMGIALQGNILGPILFFVSWTVIIIALSWYLINAGYNAGFDLATTGLLTGKRIEQLTEIMTVLGMTVIGALSATYIGLTTQLQWTFQEQTTTLQSILDGILPKLLALLLVALLWWLHQFKNWSILRLLGLTVVLGTIGAAVGIF